MSPILLTIALYLWLVGMGGVAYVILRKCYGNESPVRSA